jgi:hypothetical protein
MKLDRNTNPDGRGKYALITLRGIDPIKGTTFDNNENPCLVIDGANVDFGDTPETEFFVIRLKDKYAEAALRAYGEAALLDGDEEYASEIFSLAHKAEKHPNKKRPD